jgi:histidinol-phosphatase (PHP family)
MKKIDGHIHTPFCPHGTTDSFESYIERAISLGYEQITFTEHAPLPNGFVDSTPTKDSGMNLAALEDYFYKLMTLKEKYKENITILSGLEIDYIEGFEKETKNFLNEYGPFIEDSILSVHFLHHQGNWGCLDYSSEVFAEMTQKFGSVDKLYEQYFRTVLKSVTTDLGPYKPKRIGHITLVRKFQKLYPAKKTFLPEINEILLAMKNNQYELDYNGAGIYKKYCGQPYPTAEIVQKALEYGIKIVYGSDAHQSRDINQGRQEMKFL